MTLPRAGFSLAVSGMKRPPAVLDSSATRWTTMRSCRGRRFMDRSPRVLSLRGDGPGRWTGPLGGPGCRIARLAYRGTKEYPLEIAEESLIWHSDPPSAKWPQSKCSALVVNPTPTKKAPLIVHA